MANFSTPFASTGPRRNPSADEKANGFPCGAADLLLFNGLFHRLESELGEVIQFAGVTPSDADNTTLRQAILALIASVTGSDPDADYALTSQLSTRLPIFPEVLTSDGTFNITSPANGTIRVPGGINFLHRGVGLYTTAQTDLNTVSSKTYHLRWSPGGGFVLRDLGDNTYNPGTLPEASDTFDSTFDDMLVGRVVTNSGNVPTIVSLANKHKLTKVGSKTTMERQAGAWSGLPSLSVSLNWARTPQISLRNVSVDATTGAEAVTAIDTTVNRYAMGGMVRGYLLETTDPQRYISGSIGMEAFA